MTDADDVYDGDDLRPHQAMGPGHEFDTIRMLMARWGALATDIGDDAAVLPIRAHRIRVVTTDACVEHEHFQRAWITPHDVGVRAAAAAISDIAAMGADADAVVIAMVVPDDWREHLGDVADGIGDVVRSAGARIVGGNLSRGSLFSITTTVVGSAPKVVARRGAMPGDVVVVTGTLGGPGHAIRSWMTGTEPPVWARRRFAQPAPRLAEGMALAAAGATAMVDVSDGLAADVRHLAAASNVAIELDTSRIPCGSGITWQLAVVSGEEYELLATVPKDAATALLASWTAQFDVPLTAIGTVSGESEGGAVRFVRNDGRELSGSDDGSCVEFIPGHDHFSK